MPNGKPPRTEGYPSLTARHHWVKYAAGIATETLFVLCLTAAALALAVVAAAIFP